MATQKEVTAALKSLEGQLRAGFEEYQMIVAGLRHIEEAITEDRSERAHLRAEVVALRERVSTLETRLREVEARLTDDPPS